MVETIRDSGVNIVSAPELGHVQRDDAFHAAQAFKQKRFVLTKNEKHFHDDAIVPFHRTHGVIAVSGDFSNVESYARAVVHILQLLVPFGGLLEQTTISVKGDHVTVRGRDHAGQMFTDRFLIRNRGVYRWVDNE